MKAVRFIAAAAILLSAAARVCAQDPAARERAMRAQEEKLIEQRRQREAAENAAAARKAAAARGQRERVDAEDAIGSAVADLAAKLAGPPPGKVVGVNEQYTIVTGGKDVGAAAGDALRCFSRGEAIVADGETLGYSEQLLGSATVSEVRDKLAYLRIEGDAKPKVGDVCYRSQALGKVALMPLFHEGQRTELGDHIAERLYQALAERGVRLVERGQLARIVAEQKLGDSAFFDAKNAAHVGSLAGADALLLGTIDDTSNRILLVLRVVSSKDSVVIATRQAALPKTGASLAMLVPSRDAGDTLGAKAEVAVLDATLDNPAAQARAQVEAANRMLDAGRLDDALEPFLSATQLAPDLPEVAVLAKKLHRAPAKNAPAALKRAAAFITADRLDDAAEAFVEAVRLDPDVPGMDDVAARLAEATRKWDGDIRDSHVRRHKAKARAMMQQGQFDNADRDLAAGAALAPKDSEIATMAADLERHEPPDRLCENVLEVFRGMP